MLFRLAPAIVGLLLGGCQHSAQTTTQDVDPSAAHPRDINKRFMDPNLDAQEWVPRWESESREIFASRAEIVEALELAAGARVADVGSGTGLFVEPISAAVKDTGRLFAVDISPKFVEHIKNRVKKRGLKNVEVILSRKDSTELPEASVHVVFLCDTYHHFEFAEKMLASIRRALRKGGQLIVIDFERIPGQSREWVVNHVRAGKEQVKEEIVQAGFVFKEEVKIKGLSENYFLRFVKR